MRVLFQTRFNAFERMGGDTIQVLKTKEYIEKQYPEIQIDIKNDPYVNLNKYDIVHVFNLLRPQETSLYVRNARSQGKKVALSTIYWKSEEFENVGHVGTRKIINNILGFENIERVRAIYRYLFDGEKHEGSKLIIKKGYSKLQEYILNNVDYLLPNGQGEIDLLKKEFNLNKIPPYIVVPNAIDETQIRTENYKEREGILCVGRFEPRKNQLNLVKAMEDLPYNLFLIGKVNKTQEKYYLEIKKYIDKNPKIKIINEMDQKSLTRMYNQCKVHILPSWYDTPGLVSIEAAANGCNIVVTDKGTTKEYFGDKAYYCEPNNIASIQEAINKSYNSQYDNELKEIILKKYTWKNTAEKTVEAYKKLMN